MISQKSSIKTGNAFSLSGAGAYLRCKLKTGWASFLLYICLALIVPAMILISLGNTTGEWRGAALLSFLKSEMAQICFYISAIVAALVSSVFAWKNMHSKQSNYFEHKLPVSRSALFFSNSVFGLLLFIVPFIVMMLILLLISATAGSGVEMFSSLAVAILKLTVYTSAFYIAYFTLFSLFAAVCGNTAVHVAFSGIAVFLPYIASLCLSEQFEFISGWKLDSSPIYNLIKTSPISVYEKFGSIFGISSRAFICRALILIAVSAAVYICGMLLSMFSGSERAGEAFTYNGIKVAVKYIIIFLAMSMAAILIAMSYIESGFVTVLFSAVFIILAGFVVNMLLNMVMYRGVRRGVIKGMGGFCAVAALSVVILSAMMIRSAAPVKLSPALCKNVIISASNSTDIYLIDEKDDINGIMDIITGQGRLVYDKAEDIQSYTTDDNYATDGFLQNHFEATIIVNTTTGAKLRYILRTYLTEEGDSFIKRITSESNMDKAMLYLSDVEGIHVGDYLNPRYDDDSADSVSESELSRIFREIYLPELNEVRKGTQRELVPVYSCFFAQVYEYQTKQFPIYSDMEKTISALKKLYAEKASPYTPTFSSEDVLSYENLKLTIDVSVESSDNANALPFDGNCQKILYADIKDDRETIARLFDLYITKAYRKTVSYETAVYSDGKDHDLHDSSKNPVAYITTHMYVSWSERSIDTYLYFDSELADILGIDYGAFLDKIANTYTAAN